MKRIAASILILLCLSIGFVIYFSSEKEITPIDSPYRITKSNRDKKKILIFSCTGGGGHITVTDALTEYLSADYCVGKADIFVDVLQSIDLVSAISNNRLSAMAVHNSCAKKSWHNVINSIFSPIAKTYCSIRTNEIFKQLKAYLELHKPDLIISVAPIVNKELLKAAQQLDIPFILLPTDLDTSHFTQNIKNPTYKKFALALPYKDSKILEMIASSNIPEDQIYYVGFPVKKAFLEPRNSKIIRKEFNLPENKPIILLMMGSQGSEKLQSISKQLAKLTIPAHIVIVLGKSEHIRSALEQLKFPKHITYTILDFTKKIADLMHVSDLIITKSGTVTMNEGIYSKTPLLLDATTPVLQWEKFNHSFIERYELGNSLKKLKTIPNIVTNMLKKKDMQPRKKSLLKMKNPEEEIKVLIKKFLANK